MEQLTEIAGVRGSFLVEESPLSQQINIENGQENRERGRKNAMDMIRKKPCRIVCISLISLLMTTLIVLVNILVNLTKDILHNDKIWRALEQYIAAKENATCKTNVPMIGN
jgi:hypothetical protein